MNYGDAIAWCVKNSAVFRFVERTERQDFVMLNERVPGTLSLELAHTIDGQNYVVHVPLDSTTEPSKAIARALIAGVQHFAERRSAMITGASN